MCLQELLATSYEGTQVVLFRDGSNVTVTMATESPVRLSNLTPATRYSLEVAFLFTGGHTGPRVRREVTTGDGSKYYY